MSREILRSSGEMSSVRRAALVAAGAASVALIASGCAATESEQGRGGEAPVATDTEALSVEIITDNEQVAALGEEIFEQTPACGVADEKLVDRATELGVVFVDGRCFEADPHAPVGGYSDTFQTEPGTAPYKWENGQALEVLDYDAEGESVSNDSRGSTQWVEVKPGDEESAYVPLVWTQGVPDQYSK